MAGDFFRRGWTVIPGLTLIIGLAGCDRPAHMSDDRRAPVGTRKAPNPHGKSAQGGRSATTITADVVTTVKVKSSLIGDSRVAATGVNVDTVNGVVTLRGEVGTAAAKKTAGHLAAKTRGVQRVNNKLHVTNRK